MILRVVALVALSGGFACGKTATRSPAAPRPEARVVARVNGAPITLGDLKRAVIRLKGRPTNDRAAREQALEALVFERAIRVAARKAEVTVPEDEVDAALLAMRRGYTADAFDATLFAMRLGANELRERARDRLVTDALLRKHAVDSANVTDAEVEARWNTWPREKLPDRVRVAQIVVRTEDLAKKLREELTAKGVDKEKKFVALAKKHSLGPERKDGGRLGVFARGEGPKVFEAAFTQKVGEVGAVVASDHGYHILLVEERFPAKEAKLADVRERIVADLRETKLRESEARWRKAILAGVEIERDEKALETVQ